jgi:catechol 2,3-dioxygenase-like lactoylglutathione lyase family enzyme
MINGLHALIYVKDAAKARAFFRDVLGFRSVDAGEGWLIFAMPPAELGVHPADGDAPYHELHFMCDDLAATMADLARKRVKCSAPISAGWGTITKVTVPGGGEIGLYEPRHPTAIRTKPSAAKTKAKAKRRAPARKPAPRRRS